MPFVKRWNRHWETARQEAINTNKAGIAWAESPMADNPGKIAAVLVGLCVLAVVMASITLNTLAGFTIIGLAMGIYFWRAFKQARVGSKILGWDYTFRHGPKPKE